jgi:hypothetical protein
MSAEFASALAKLDESLRIVRSQLECLRAALEVNEDQFSRSLGDAAHQAQILRGLIRVERPDANWMDREDLDQLIHAVGSRGPSEAPTLQY